MTGTGAWLDFWRTWRSYKPNIRPCCLGVVRIGGQYLDALAASDEGDILPLYDVFVKSLRRVVLTMEKPNYVDSKIRYELLATTEQRHRAWQASADTFLTCLQHKAREADWSVRLMGYPSAEDFD